MLKIIKKSEASIFENIIIESAIKRAMVLNRIYHKMAILYFQAKSDPCTNVIYNGKTTTTYLFLNRLKASCYIEPQK